MTANCVRGVTIHMTGDSDFVKRVELHVAFASLKVRERVNRHAAQLGDSAPLSHPMIRSLEVMDG